MIFHLKMTLNQYTECRGIYFTGLTPPGGGAKMEAGSVWGKKWK